jgi:hypothetical protein
MTRQQRPREPSLAVGISLLRITVLLTVIMLPAAAQTVRSEQLRIEAERHLRSCGEGTTDARRRCESNRQTFLQAYVRARGGDYQAQRAVARLLAAASGTESAPTALSAVIPNRLEACAWRVVIANADHQDVRDEVREFRDCGRLTESEFLAANLRASELMALIANAPATNEITLPGADGEGS